MRVKAATTIFEQFGGKQTFQPSKENHNEGSRL